MTMTVPARVVGLHLPTTTEDSEQQVRDRLSRSLRKRRLDHYGKSDGVGGFLGSDEEFESWLEMGQISPDDRRRVFARARRFHKAKVTVMGALSHIKPDERKSLMTAAYGSRARGVVGRDLMEERIAALHSEFPWLAAASNAVMQHMRGRTLSGPAPFHTPPLILLGPPGIAKSSWARAVARIFALPSVDIDIGASNGAVFSIAGVERGWGSAAPGRVVQSMLREKTANPLVIIDEIDKIPDQVATTKGSTLPGAFEALKSMIEPTSARRWSCPFYQVPIDLTGVSWIMTSNSISQLPAAFLDRCKVVELGYPTPDQLVRVGWHMMQTRLPEDMWDIGEDAISQAIFAKHSPTSLRMVERMSDSIVDVLLRPRLM
jgi:hypothetical protein